MNKKNAFVPYRDSKLTRLLKETLGGKYIFFLKIIYKTK